MAAKRTKRRSIPQQSGEPQRRTPTFLLEMPLVVNEGQAKRLRGHLEAGRQFYNAVLGEGQRRLRQMRADPAWQAARAIPHTQQPARNTAFSALRQQYGFSEYALHAYAKTARISWLADHLDAVLAQTLASRAYHALNRVCLGQAKRVRFKSRGRGLASLENKRNDTGLRFVLDPAAAGSEGQGGMLLWQGDRLPALIDWHDPVVKYGLDHRIKYARLIRRQASSPRAQGADAAGSRYACATGIGRHALSEAEAHGRHRHHRDRVFGLPPSPSSLAPGRQRWNRWGRSLLLMPKRSDDSNAKWIGSAGPPIRSTTTKKDASGDGASNGCCGSGVTPTSAPAGVRHNENANWRRTAKVCMGTWRMKSYALATPSSSKRSAIKRGRNSMVKVWDCALQGCLLSD
jgi:hypothetical protein